MKFHILSLLLIIVAACAPQQRANSKPSPYVAKPNTHPYSIPIVQRGEAISPIISELSQQQNTGETEVKIGLLLPLSGENAQLGQTMLDGAMLALFDKYALNPNVPRIMLLPKNTGANAGAAIKAANDAIQGGAKLLLGPLDAETTASIKPIAAKHGVNIISFSNSTNIAGKGVYLIGFMMQEQLGRIIQHVAQQQKQHLAVMLPSNNQSDMVEGLLRQDVAKYGIKEISVVRYGAGLEDFANIASQLRSVSISKKQSGAGDIDAILLLEGGERTIKLAEAIRAQNITAPFYSTGLMDNQALLGTSALLGAEFASTSPRSYTQFAKRFEYEYGYTPNKIASLAYDATNIVATLFAHGSGDSITKVQGFNAPANGLIRFNGDGTNQRSLAIIKIGNGVMQELVPAKRYFE
jgi:branched-chain amino acid transport system substrate-binding protein